MVRDLKREHGLGFSTRVGIHSGEVVVGKIGEALRPRALEARAGLAAVLGDESARARDLAEALRLYRATGAEGHAARLAG